MFATRKRRIRILVLSVLAMVGVGVCLVASYRFIETQRLSDPNSEAILAHYLSTSENGVLLQEVANVQGKELGMGQGVYLRFEAGRESLFEFLNQEAEDEYCPRYPFAAISCQDFYDAYPAWADGIYEWWRPRDALSPECYVTKCCEYLLLDNDGETVYYYFPDFLGKDFYCVNAQGERGTVRRR